MRAEGKSPGHAAAQGPKQTLGVSTECIPELIKWGAVSPTG